MPSSQGVGKLRSRVKFVYGRDGPGMLQPLTYSLRGVAHVPHEQQRGGWALLEALSPPANGGPSLLPAYLVTWTQLRLPSPSAVLGQPSPPLWGTAEVSVGCTQVAGSGAQTQWNSLMPQGERTSPQRSGTELSSMRSFKKDPTSSHHSVPSPPGTQVIPACLRCWG